jgi:hypothetical protein
LSTSAVTNSPVGTYVITNTPGTLSATNYAISYTNGVLTVTPLPSPMILSFGVTNRVITVTWSSVSGATYELQSITNLAGTNWVNVQSNVTATGSITRQTNAIGNVPQQFYRVIYLNP